MKGLQETKPAKVEDDAWEDMQVQAAATIRLCLADQVMYHVMDEDSPKGIWDKLASRYMSKSATNQGRNYVRAKLGLGPPSPGENREGR